MKPVLTKDGSQTFFNEEYQDHYHSKSGAFEEAREKFVMPCQKFFLHKDITIYDICFGLGYNTTVAIHEILKVNPSCTITVYAFENDKNIINQMNSVQTPSQYAETYVLVGARYQSSSNISVVLIMGDVRETLSSAEKAADIVFHDPFAPQRCPALWTENLFSQIYKKMRHKSVLTTYSCARFVRKNMQHAGFRISDGPVVGRRSPSTIAWKTPRFSPM